LQNWGEEARTYGERGMSDDTLRSLIHQFIAARARGACSESIFIQSGGEIILNEGREFVNKCANDI